MNHIVHLGIEKAYIRILFKEKFEPMHIYNNSALLGCKFVSQVSTSDSLGWCACVSREYFAIRPFL